MRRVSLAAAGVIALPLLFRGAFPVPYMLVAASAVLLAFVVLRLLGRMPELKATGATYALGALVLAYIAAVPGAADVNAAVAGALLMGAAVAAYWLGRRVFRDPGDAVLAVALAGGAASLVGLTALVFQHGPLHNMVDPSTGRLAGVLEYANASGMLSGLGAAAAWLSAGGPWLGIIGALSFAALLHTASFGSVLVTLAAAAVTAAWKRERWPRVAAVLLAGGVAYVAGGATPVRFFLGVLASLLAPIVETAITRAAGRLGKRGSLAAAAGVLGLVVAFAAVRASSPLVLSGGSYQDVVPASSRALRVVADGRVTTHVFAVLPDAETRAVGSLEGSGVVGLRAVRGATRDLVEVAGEGRVLEAEVLAGGSWRPVPFTAARILPGVLYSHYLSFLQSGYDWQSRLAMFGDGLRLIGERPLLGFGGGGWGAVYSSAQSFPYVSSEPHDFLVQVGVESGLVGLLALLAALAFVAGEYLKSRRSRPGLDAAAILAAALLVHSLMDWDLAVPGLLLLFFGLLGALSGGEVGERPLLWRSPVYLGAVGAVAAAILAAGQFYGAAGDALLAKGKPLSALPYYQEALALDPASGAYRYDLAQIDEQLGQVNPAAEAEAGDLYRSAVRLAPGSYLFRARYGLFLARAGRAEEAVRQLQAAVALAPERLGVYQVAVSSEEWLGYEALLHGKKGLARTAFSDAVGDAFVMQEMSARQPSWAPPAFRLPQSDSTVGLYAGAAAMFLHRWRLARRLLPPLSADLSVEDARTLALCATAIAWHDGDARWPVMLRAFSRRFPGLEKEWAALRRTLEQPI